MYKVKYYKKLKDRKAHNPDTNKLRVATFKDLSEAFAFMDKVKGILAVG